MFFVRKKGDSFTNELIPALSAFKRFCRVETFSMVTDEPGNGKRKGFGKGAISCAGGVVRGERTLKREKRSCFHFLLLTSPMLPSPLKLNLSHLNGE